MTRNINSDDLRNLPTFHDLSKLEHRMMRLHASLAEKTQTSESRYSGDFEQVESEYKYIYVDYLSNLLINLIKYENAPDTLDTRFLEFNLRSFGYCRIGGTDKNNIFVLKSDKEPARAEYTDLGFLTDTAEIENPYSTAEADKLKLITHINYQNLDKGYLNISNKYSYLTSGQFTTFTDFQIIERVAKTLANIKATEVFNENQMKVPYIVFSKNKNLTGINTWSQIAQGVPVVQIDADQVDNINDIIQVANLTPPNFLPQLKDAWNNEIDELLTILGINNVGVDKKERLVASEADSNSQLIEASGNIYLEARNRQLKLINEVFGTNIKAVFNQDSYNKLVSLKQSENKPNNEKDEKERGGE